MVSVSKNEVNLDNPRQVADEKAIPVLEYDEPLLIITLGDWVDEESGHSRRRNPSGIRLQTGVARVLRAQTALPRNR